MSSTEILSLVEQYKEAQQLIEAAQAEMDDLKRQITEEMTRRDVDTMDAGTHKVRYQTVTSSRLDSKGLKAAAPELAARKKERDEEIKTAADDLTADELEKVLQYIQTVKRRRTAE